MQASLPAVGPSTATTKIALTKGLWISGATSRRYSLWGGGIGMKELLVFIAYRGDDGLPAARLVRDSIGGRSIYLREGSLLQPRTVSVYFDRASPISDSWRRGHENFLANAHIMLLICSPGAAKEFSPLDELYAEIRWWLANRSSPPLLVTTLGSRWIPELVLNQYSEPQTVPVDDPSLVDRVLASFEALITPYGEESPSMSAPTEWGRHTPAGLYVWEKDKNFRYVSANDNYARAAGFDSAEAMIGKTDDDTAWRKLADYFRSGDQAVMESRNPHRIHVAEVELMVDRVAEVLVTESRIVSGSGSCLGVTGFFIEAAGMPTRLPSALDLLGLGEGASVDLGPEFGDMHLSGAEGAVLKGLLCDMQVPTIAERLRLEIKEVDSVIRSLLNKFGVQSIGDLVVTSIRSGLPLRLFNLPGSSNAD
jgi:hypothetical protein